MMDKIYFEQKAINRSLQRINNIIIMAIFAGFGKNAKLCDDEKGKKLCKIGIALTAVVQGLLFITEVIEVIKQKEN